MVVGLRPLGLSIPDRSNVDCCVHSLSDAKQLDSCPLSGFLSADGTMWTTPYIVEMSTFNFEVLPPATAIVTVVLAQRMSVGYRSFRVWFICFTQFLLVREFLDS